MSCPHHSLYRINSGVVAPSPRGSAPSAAGLDEEDGTETASGDRGYSGASSGSGSANSRVPPEGGGATLGAATGVTVTAGSKLGVAVCGMGGIARSSIPWSINTSRMRAALFRELWSSLTHMYMCVKYLPGVALPTAIRKARATSSGGLEKAPQPAADTIRRLHVLVFAASRTDPHNRTRGSNRPGVRIACPSLLKWKAARTGHGP